MSSPEKLLPQNIEAEAGVLGSLLIDPGAIGQIAETLHPEDFYREAHREIYRASLDLYKTTGPADLIMLTDELTRRGKLEEVGGASYVTSLANQVPTSQNVKHYAGIVARTATLRRLISASGQIAHIAYAEPDASVALDEAEKLIGEVRTHADRASVTKEPRFKLLSDDEIMNLEPAAGIVGNILFENTIAFLYSREGRWKTFLALDWGMCLASDHAWHGRRVTAGPVVYIAAEGAHGIGKRIAAWKAHHGVHESTAIKVLGRPVQLLDASEVRQLITDIRAQVSGRDPVLVVIDTLARSMIGGDENSARDINDVTAAAYAIKEAFGCCVLVVHHTGKDDVRGLRGSSALRSNADVIIRVASADESKPRIEPGQPVTVKCEKTKDDAPFADITLTAQIETVAKENGVTFNSLVLVPAEPATVQPKALTSNQQKALDTLYLAPMGMRAKKWLAATGLPERSFYDARDVIAKPEHGLLFVVKDATDTYTVSAEGEKHVTAELLRPHCEYGSRTANAEEDASYGDSEFISAEATAKLREPIGDPQLRSSSESAPRCPSCGRASDELRDYGDGVLRCIVCDVPAEKGVAS